jgi:hypothetical protein
MIDFSNDGLYLVANVAFFCTSDVSSYAQGQHNCNRMAVHVIRPFPGQTSSARVILRRTLLSRDFPPLLVCDYIG